MPPILRNILAVIAGAIVGGYLNMFIIKNGGSVLPVPEGVDPTDFESIKTNAHLYTFKHYLNPFLAHALGTLVGAFITTKLAASKKFGWPLAIGVLFLIGGVMAAFMIPAFKTFAIFDILLAYTPMAYLGWKLAGGKSSSNLTE